MDLPSGGRAPHLIGAPLLVAFGAGSAYLFDGADDALELAENPLQGMSAYTVEVIFRPDAGGHDEQRFLHAGTVHGDRFLFETRPAGDGLWCLDAFVQSGRSSRALIDRTRGHTLGQWHAAAATVGSGRLAAYVDGVLQGAADLPADPAPAGRLSLGCRQNRVSWFKGAIAAVRITPRVLAPEELLRAP